MFTSIILYPRHPVAVVVNWALRRCATSAFATSLSLALHASQAVIVSAAATVRGGRVTSLACADPSGQRLAKLAVVCLAVCFSKPLILRPNSSVSSINTHGSNFLDTDYTWI